MVSDLFETERRRMVDRQIRRRGIADEQVLGAMEQVPRHLFVDPDYRDRAYEDYPLPIGNGQTISQPYMVARMTELCHLSATDCVLEIGAGSGYQTAILAKLCRYVFALELLGELAKKAERLLRDMGYDNVTISQGDGSGGWPEHSPYQAILVAAGAPAVPPILKDQLAEEGRLVIPVGGREIQILQCITRQGREFRSVQDTPCRFVDLRGEYGWDRKNLS